MRPQADILTAAIALIERGWTQRAPARTSDGRPCGPTSPEAAAWCITGAIYCRDFEHIDFTAHFLAEKLVRAVLGFDKEPDDGDDALDPEQTKKKRKPDSITAWNDNPERTADEVLDVLRIARAAALKAMTVVRRQIFVSNNPHLLPVIGWRDSSGAFVPDDPAASVDHTDGIFMDVESNEDTPTIPPPPDGSEGEPSA